MPSILKEYDFDAEGVTFDGQYLWVNDWTEEELYMVTRNGVILKTFDLSAMPILKYLYQLAFDGQYLWGINQNKDKIITFDRQCNVVSNKAVDAVMAGIMTGIEVIGNSLYIVNHANDKVYLLDKTTLSIIKTWNITEPYGICTNGAQLFMSRIDTDKSYLYNRNMVRMKEILGFGASDFAWDGQYLWVGTGAGGELRMISLYT